MWPFIGKPLRSTSLFVIQFCPVCNFEKFINFGLGTATSGQKLQQIWGDSGVVGDMSLGVNIWRFVHKKKRILFSLVPMAISFDPILFLSVRCYKSRRREHVHLDGIVVMVV